MKTPFKETEPKREHTTNEREKKSEKKKPCKK